MATKIEEKQEVQAEVVQAEVAPVAEEPANVRVVSNTNFDYLHPYANTVIDTRSVLVPNDSWTKAQLVAGYIVLSN